MLAAGKPVRPLFGLQYSPQSVRLRLKEIKFPARSRISSASSRSSSRISSSTNCAPIP